MIPHLKPGGPPKVVGALTILIYFIMTNFGLDFFSGHLGHQLRYSRSSIEKSLATSSRAPFKLHPCVLALRDCTPEGYTTLTDR